MNVIINIIIIIIIILIISWASIYMCGSSLSPVPHSCSPTTHTIKKGGKKKEKMRGKEIPPHKCLLYNDNQT